MIRTTWFGSLNLDVTRTVEYCKRVYTIGVGQAADLALDWIEVICQLDSDLV